MEASVEEATSAGLREASSVGGTCNFDASIWE